MPVWTIDMLCGISELLGIYSTITNLDRTIVLEKIFVRTSRM